MLHESSLWRVFTAFCRKPTTWQTAADISRHANLTYPPVKQHLETLLKDDLILLQSRTRGNRIFPEYSANIASKKFQYWKSIANHLSLHSLISHIADTTQPQCIVLFGSYARGQDTEESDIDLFIQPPVVFQHKNTFEKQLSRRIQVHSRKKFTDMSKELQQTVANGLVLHGFIDIYDAENDNRPRKGRGPKKRG